MKQYPLLHHRAAKVLFALFLTAMLFLSRDTLFFYTCSLQSIHIFSWISCACSNNLYLFF